MAGLPPKPRPNAVYLVVSLRNVGNGLAVLDRWDVNPYVVAADDPAEANRLAGQQRPRDIAQFRRLTRDLYLPAGELGFWQGALRDPSETLFKEASDAIVERRMLTLDLLYSDLRGGQTEYKPVHASPGRSRPVVCHYCPALRPRRAEPALTTWTAESLVCVGSSCQPRTKA